MTGGARVSSVRPVTLSLRSSGVRARLARLLSIRRNDELDDSGLPERGIDARAALVVLLVAALSAAFGGLLLWRARPHSADVGPVPAAVVVAEPTAPAMRAIVTTGLAATPSPTPTVAEDRGIVVDVQGRVRRPGTVNLPTGARVRDALNAAGGPRDGASTRSLNLAAPLSDGEQIVLGPDCPGSGLAPATESSAAPPPSAQSSVVPAWPRPATSKPAVPAAPAVLDLNRATAAELDTLPGIGPVLAERIVAYRTTHGRFTSVDELREVSGIGQAKLAEIRSRVRV